MEKIDFLVKGSNPEPHEVVFKLEGKNLTASCDCTAAEFGQYCHHRLDILKGQDKDIVSDNKKDVKIIQSWLPGTDVDKALKEVLAAEKCFEDAKDTLTARKKQLARVLKD